MFDRIFPYIFIGLFITLSILSIYYPWLTFIVIGLCIVITILDYAANKWKEEINERESDINV